MESMRNWIVGAETCLIVAVEVLTELLFFFIAMAFANDTTTRCFVTANDSPGLAVLYSNIDRVNELDSYSSLCQVEFHRLTSYSSWISHKDNATCFLPLSLPRPIPSIHPFNRPPRRIRIQLNKRPCNHIHTLRIQLQRIRLGFCLASPPSR